MNHEIQSENKMVVEIDKGIRALPKYGHYHKLIMRCFELILRAENSR